MKSKKPIVVLSAALSIIILCIISYVNIGKLVMHREMEAYLKSFSF